MISEINNVAFNFDYWCDESTAPHDFQMRFRPVTRAVKSFKEEAIETAKYIRANTDKPIYVAAGGGIDSELVCHAFLDANIEFKVFTCKWMQWMNEYDIRMARDFCNKYKIEQVFSDFDPYSFFIHGIDKYIEQGYQSSGIYRYYQLHILEEIDKLGGTCVFGAGETNYHCVDDEIKLPYKSELIAPLQWIKNSGNVHFARFFENTPEMSAAYHMDPLIKFLATDPTYFRDPHILNFQPEKIILYHHIYPQMPKRVKYVGLESIFGMKKEVEKRLKKLFPNLASIYIPLSEVKDQLGI